MKNENWAKIQDLFHQVIDLPETELDDYFDLLENHSEHIIREVKLLIAADRRKQAKTEHIQQSLTNLSHEINTPQINGYDDMELIAQGGMGSVYRAVDARLSRDVAIKVLHPYLSGQEKFKERFMREARAAARIQHENINTIFEIAESPDGTIHIASAFCEGKSLAQRIRQKEMNLQQILFIMRQLVSALKAAHAQGIVHRDLKPENIIIDDDFNLKLVDFGIAKIRDEHQTSTGDIIGTPAYMSPEQFRGEAIDPLTDMWATGMILYELLEGRTPFEGKTAPEIIYSMLHEPIPYSTSQRNTLRPLYDIIQKCLNIDKNLRPANAEMMEQLLLGAITQLESTEHYDTTPKYDELCDPSPSKSHPSIATHKKILVLYLFVNEHPLSDDALQAANALVKKYRGQLLNMSGLRNETCSQLIACFGYPLADELTLRNGLLCALAWTEQTRGEKIYKGIALYQHITDASNTSPQDPLLIKPLDEDTQNFVLDNQKQGIWVDDSLLSLVPETLANALPTSSQELELGVYPFEKRQSEDPHPFAIKLSPFTGRDSQLAVLKENWEQAVEEDFQRVLISGEAGIGKSRLIYEFKKSLQQVSEVQLIELACSPYEQSSTYYPILNYLKQKLYARKSGINSDTLQKQDIQKYLEKLWVPEPLECLLLCQLFNVELSAEELSSLPSGDLLNRRYQSLLSRIITARPDGFTTLLIIEDLHWVDHATSQIIEMLLQPSSLLNTLLVMSCRPEYKPSWLTNVITSNLYLSKLRQSQSETLLKRLIEENNRSSQKQAIDAGQLLKLAERTGGNPLFIEELAKSMPRDSSIEERVPDSIQDTLTGRLERLGLAKELAQIAAVIGRNFTLSLLKQCAAFSDSDFQQQFNTLVQAEIFYPTNDANHWYFKHALIRDAAYQTLQQESRQQLHSTIASSIEQSDPELTQNQPSLLALHWEKSLNYTKAVYYWQQSAQLNLTLFAISDSIEQCQHALSLSEHLDSPDKESQQLAIYTTLGPALMNRYGYADDKAGEAYAKALELCKELNAEQHMIRILFGNWTYRCVRAEHLMAYPLSQEMIRISTANGNRNEICESFMVQGINDFYRGEFLDARQTLQTAIDHYDRDQSTHHIITYGQSPYVAATVFQAWNELILGDIPRAHQHAINAVAHARETNHPMSLGYALSFATYVFMNTGEFEEAEKLVTESIKVCSENEVILFLGLSLILRALLYFNMNDINSGEQTMTRAQEVYLPTGAQVMLPNFFAVQAEVLLKAGRLQEAEGLINQSLALIEQTRENWCLAPVLAIKLMIHQLKNEHETAAEMMKKLVETLAYQKAEGIRLMLQQKGFSFPATD